MSSSLCTCLIRLLNQARGPKNCHAPDSFLIRIKKSDLNSPPSLLRSKPFPPPMSRRHPLSGRAAALRSPRRGSLSKRCRDLPVQSKRICSSFVPQKQIPPPPPRHLVPPFLVLKWGDHRGAFVPRIESRIASRIAFHPSLCNSVMRHVYNKIRVFKSRRHGENFMNSPQSSRSSQGTPNFLRGLRGLCGKFHLVMQCVYHSKNTVGCNSPF